MKKFYIANRETIASLNYRIQRMSIIPPFSSQIINSCLKSRISSNHDKVDRGTFSQWLNPYKGDCFSIVKYLLKKSFRKSNLLMRPAKFQSNKFFSILIKVWQYAKNVKCNFYCFCCTFFSLKN